MERTPHAGKADTVRSAPSRSEREVRRINEFVWERKVMREVRASERHGWIRVSVPFSARPTRTRLAQAGHESDGSSPAGMRGVGGRHAWVRPRRRSSRNRSGRSVFCRRTRRPPSRAPDRSARSIFQGRSPTGENDQAGRSSRANVGRAARCMNTIFSMDTASASAFPLDGHIP